MYEKYGYKLITEEFVEECDAKALLLEHKTGARLLKLKNNDDNKTFGIGFRTPPENSTGVAHIVEHCVLSGSRKFKTKDPFMDLYKGSLQTFLNAITWPDKTVYPVASRNAKDFKNLMDVYLDAVFYPRLHTSKEVFMQEGWHYELLNEDDELSYKGVVYNEMKGAMSSAEDQIDELINAEIFKGSTYMHNSGGDPYTITDLTYDDFKAFHKKYYHPSNSYIFLYGDGDFEEELKLIDSYLKDFEKKDIDSKIIDLVPFKERKYFEGVYSTTDDVENKNKDFISYSVVTGQSLEDEVEMATNVLEEVLIDSSAGAIRKAVLEKGLAEVVMSSGSDNKYSSFRIILKDADGAKAKEFEALVKKVLEDEVKNGLDKKQLLSALNRIEYSLREAEGYATRGIIYNINAFSSWLYDESPLKALKYNPILKKLREGIDKGYFEKFIEDRILNNPHTLLAVFKPDKGLNDRKDEKVKERLKEYKASLSKDEIKALIDENMKLIEEQSSEDSEEAKATIPQLELEDISTDIPKVPREVEEKEGVTFLYHDIFTAGINYFSINFDLSHLDPKDASYISLLAALMAEVDTEKFSYEDLSSEIYLRSGGMNFTATIFENVDEDERMVKFLVTSKVLGDDTTKALDLIKEILFSSKFDDKVRLKEVITEMKSNIEMRIFQVGNSVAANRLRSYFDPMANFVEKISGIDFFFFLQDLLQDFDTKADGLIEKLTSIYKTLFKKDQLIVNFTGTKDGYDNFTGAIDGIIREAVVNCEEKYTVDEVNHDRNEGFMSSSNVQYVAKGADLKSLGVKYTGKLQVLCQFLSKGYLYNEVRAKGGAYGTGIWADKKSIVTSSYRDPNLKNTLKIYDEMAGYLRSLKISEKDMKNTIIGSMGAFDPPLTARQRGEHDLVRFIQKTNPKEKEERLKEALATTEKDLVNMADMIDKAMKENNISVLGQEKKIKEDKDVFGSIKYLLK